MNYVQAVILAVILAGKCILRAFTASRKASRKFSQASRKSEKLRLGGILIGVPCSLILKVNK